MRIIGVKHNDAVSPVIGILLMLVVTIIIAAVVSGFASGLAGNQNKAPQASVSAAPDISDYSIIFENQGGDTFSLDSVSVVFQSQDTKVTLTTADVGTNCLKFEPLGSTNTMISSGDKFLIQGTEGYSGAIDFGNFSINKNTKSDWMITDKKSTSQISRGTFIWL